MAKRVYTETIKAWARKIGIGGVTLIGLLFMYLIAVGAISDVSYSGDVICAGTLDDPCYAFINFTANEDIFIYPTNYDPYGRDTLFNFDPNVKSWRLERSWGSGWRNIPLNKSCTGTWCGLSNSKDIRKFSIAFRKGRDYRIRIVAYKNNPNENIKWGAFSGVDEIDPTWLGIDNGLGIATIQTTGQAWTITHASGEEAQLELWTANAKDKKTEIGFIIPEGEKCSDTKWKTAINVYDRAGASIKNSADGKDLKDLKCGSAKCDGKDCYHLSLTNAQSSNLQDLDYIKLGESSIAIEYQDQNLINYQLDFADVNVSLTCEDVNQNDIFIYENPDNYKFGANGTFEGLKNCSYTIESTAEIQDNVWSPYIVDPDVIEKTLSKNHHVFDFTDICSKDYNGTSANCSFDYHNDTNFYLEINFISDNNIDPAILVSTDTGSPYYFATGYISNKNIVVGSNGDLYAVWIDDGRDLRFGNSSDDGLTWSSQEILAGTYRDNAILVDSNNVLYTYSQEWSYQSYIMNSTDNGVTWGSPVELFNSTSGIVSCNVDSNDIVHCATAVNSALYYTNSSDFGGATIVNSNTSNPVDNPDIEVDSSDCIYITGINRATDTLYLWGSCANGWGDTNRIQIYDRGTSATYNSVIAISDTDEIYVAFSNHYQEAVCNSTKGGISNWDCQIIINGYLPNDLAVDSNGNVYVISRKRSSPNDMRISNSSNGGVSWSSTSGEGVLATGTVSIADTMYPTSNQMGGTLRFLYTNLTNYIKYDSIVMWEEAVVDNDYPVFSNYWDNNGTLVDSGTGLFNVTVLNTNGTVLLEINGTNTTATNLSMNIYNVSYDFTGAGTYTYRWHSWGNGTDENYNVSVDRDYVVNESRLISLDLIYPTGNINVTQNEFFNVTVNVTCTQGECGTVNVSLDPIEVGTNAGFVTVAPTSDPEGTTFGIVNGLAFVFKDTSPSNSIKITEIGWWCDNAVDEANFEVGLYSADGVVVPNEAGTRLFVDTTNAKGTDAGWKTVAVDWDIDSNTDYWLGFQSDGTENTYANRFTTGGGGIDWLAESTLPNPFGGGALAGVNNKLAIYALVESSASTKSGLINDTIGATPFYTNETNPQTTASLSSGESETVTFWVNATGAVDITHLFYAYANLTSNLSISNVTGDWNVTIVEAEAGDTCTCAGAGENWEVNMSHYCNQTDTCTLTTGTLSFIGTSGYFNCSAALNYTNRGALPSTTTFYHSDGCIINKLIILLFISTSIFKKKRRFSI